MNLGTIKLSERSKGIVLGPELPMQCAESLICWRKMWAEILEHSYLDLPACLITIDPQPWSVMREFSAAPTEEANGHEYLVIPETRCSGSLLRTVAESEDFRRGLLFVSSEFSDELTRVYETIVRFGTISVLPANCNNLLLCVADGAVLWWVDTSPSKNELMRFVANLSHKFGFSLEIVASP
jgi:hypothetical protein